MKNTKISFASPVSDLVIIFKMCAVDLTSKISSSRTFWDDHEEGDVLGELTEKLHRRFEIGEDKCPVKSNMFLILEGNRINDFANEVLFENTRHVFDIVSNERAIQAHTVHYNEDKNLLIAALNDDLQYSGEIANLLSPYADKSKSVVTISLRPKIEFKDEQILNYTNDTCVVRGINVSHPDLKELEAPNFIAGAAAGVATYCELLGQATSSYVLYVDKLPLDSTSAKSVLRVLATIGVPCKQHYKPYIRDSSNLYL